MTFNHFYRILLIHKDTECVKWYNSTIRKEFIVIITETALKSWSYCIKFNPLYKPMKGKWININKFFNLKLFFDLEPLQLFYNGAPDVENYYEDYGSIGIWNYEERKYYAICDYKWSG